MNPKDNAKEDEEPEDEEESLGLWCWRDRSKECPDDHECCKWTLGFPGKES